MDWQALFLSPQGRIGRRDFWIGFAIVVAASFVVSLIPIIGQIAGLALLWPQTCIHAKRLHDAGRSAWLLLIPAAVTAVCVAVAFVTGGMALIGARGLEGDEATSSALMGMGAAVGWFGVAMLFGLGFLLWVGLSPGDPGDNRFGPPPPAGA